MEDFSMNHVIVEKFREKLSNLSDYRGLKSPGLTCYLNSVLQVLFMTQDFREAVKRCSNQDSASIDPHLAKLFSELEKCTARTHNITKELGITDVYEQRDAAEYLEKILCLTSPEATEIFRGKMNHKITCSICEECSISENVFWILPLSVEESCVKKGMEAFCRGEKFSGDNKMYCNRCNKKRDATLKCEITQNPEILTLLLKKFSFDYEHKRYVKLNCSIKVPQTLETEVFRNCTYDLYALIHHFGDLKGGHYTAEIKSYENGEWYCFNDAIVEKVNKSIFAAGTTSVRSHTAYLLMYRKVNRQQSERPTEDDLETCLVKDCVAEGRRDLTETGEDLVPRNRLRKESCERERKLAAACVWSREEELPHRDAVITDGDAYSLVKGFNLETLKHENNIQRDVREKVGRMSSDAECLRECRKYGEEFHHAKHQNGHRQRPHLKEEKCHVNTRGSPVVNFGKYPDDNIAGPKKKSRNINMVSLETHDDDGTNTEKMRCPARNVTDSVSRNNGEAKNDREGEKKGFKKERGAGVTADLGDFGQTSPRNLKNPDTVKKSFRCNCTSMPCVKANNVMRDERKIHMQSSDHSCPQEPTPHVTKPESLKKKKAAKSRVNETKPAWR